VGVFVARSKARQEKAFFKITYTDIAHLADGQTRLKGKRVRFIDVPTGQYRETDYLPDGTESLTHLVSKQGVFMISKDSLFPMDEFKPPSAASFLEETVKKNAAGTANILGYTAYVHRSVSGSVETWTVPELGSHVPLKTIMYAGDRVGYTALEAVEISLQPAPSANFFNPPNLPVDTSKLERLLEKAQADKNQAAIDRYTRLLSKWKK
jgi:hypothetical protein